MHDSPDYRQLKVSVFNDDKRTDLIGETWVSLDKVLVSGGGTSDIWHTLNCKGRYAGELRMELTYYDTRPKEEKVQESSGAQYPIESEEREFDRVGGPRQSKAVKRRPLPADPTTTNSSPLRPLMPDHAQSSPIPQTTPRSYHNVLGTTTSSRLSQGRTEYPRETGLPLPYPTYETSVQPELHHPKASRAYESLQYTQQTQGQLSFAQGNYHTALQDNQHDMYDDSIAPIINSAHNPVPKSGNYRDDQVQHIQNFPADLELPELPPYNSRLSRPVADNIQKQFPQGGSYSSPVGSYATHYQSPKPSQQQLPLTKDVRSSAGPSPRGEIYHNSPLQQYSRENHYSIQSSPAPLRNDEEILPPPPPIHRSSGVRSISTHGDTPRENQFPDIAAPSPLNTGQGRGSINDSPVSRSYLDLAQEDHPLSASPVSTYISSSSAAPVPEFDSYSSSERRQSHDPEHISSSDLYSRPPPPSLVAGYDPAIAEAESQRLWQEKQALPARQYAPVPAYNRQLVPQSPHTSPMVQHDGINPLTQKENLQYKANRNSASVIKPIAVSPNPRTPVRKSVSPRPAPREGSLGPVPFSPDSYEALNPNLKSASSINSLGPIYNTPEAVRDALKQKEQEEKIEEGPIIGSDGRIIDPSDHLPTETWAPEPERKQPRKGPEITFRFRQSPQGAQPMPPSAPRPPRETVIRPVSTIATVHSYSTDGSPTTAARNRLQKKTRVLPHANSSPVLPTNTSTPLSAYPLKEHVNYGANSSPGYPGSSPIGPPPIPAKVPLAAGQEDWGRDALSEEMRRIDIGVGPGLGARVRRSRYGP